jgi:uncharacterized repeat protein (TIGR01451 family)
VTVSAMTDPDSPLEGSDSATVRIVGDGPDVLSVTKDCDPDDEDTFPSQPGTVIPGGSATCTVTITNNGDFTVTGLQMTDTLAPGTTVTGHETTGAGFSCGFPDTDSEFVCTDDALPAGQTDRVEYTIEIDEDVPPGSDLQNTVEVTSDNAAPVFTSDTISTVSCTISGSTRPVGTEGDDVICGTPDKDQIAALGGNDIVFGFGENDQINAGDGNDTVFGGDGDDQIAGMNGDDRLFGNAGNDSVSGGSGNDECVGENEGGCEA